MKKNKTKLLLVFLVFIVTRNAFSQNIVVTPDTFDKYGWTKERVNKIEIKKMGVPWGTTTTFTNDPQDLLNNSYISIVCDHDQFLDKPFVFGKPHLGSVYLDLRTFEDATLFRIRLRNNLYSGTRLDQISKLSYKTYVEYRSKEIVKGKTVFFKAQGPTGTWQWQAPFLTLQIYFTDNPGLVSYINFVPSVQHSKNNSAYSDVKLGEWQEWDAMNGYWSLLVDADHVRPDKLVGLPDLFTLAQLHDKIPDATIRNTSLGETDVNKNPIDQPGGGIRFTVGGSSNWYNFKGYFDQFTIGTTVIGTTVYDFSCRQ